jgi:hypothetical protein
MSVIADSPLKLSSRARNVITSLRIVITSEARNLLFLCGWLDAWGKTGPSPAKVGS